MEKRKVEEGRGKEIYIWPGAIGVLFTAIVVKARVEHSKYNSR